LIFPIKKYILCFLTKRAAMTIINETIIQEHLDQVKQPDKAAVRDVLQQALDADGLNLADITTLMHVEDPDLLEELFDTAKAIKSRIYGKRLVLFAPLYISNFCRNVCTYCAFSMTNERLKRCMLTQEQIQHETEELLETGQKRLLLVSGESSNLDYILQSIKTIYAVRLGANAIRRINVNIAPLSLEQFRLLKQAAIGTYQLFQETYHLSTYESVHLKGPKANYAQRLKAIDLAMQAGIDDLGMGVLFGLYNWRFELLALMQHIQHLQNTFGIGPHTLSVPRIEPAFGSSLSESPPYAVSDADFKKIIAVLRLAVPYTGIILSTRENQETRAAALELGVSQLSAGSRTHPGGYQQRDEAGDQMSQFSLGDHRSLDEVVRNVTELGYIPSFCTGCYRRNRTGAEFMELAKPGDIKYYCTVNALITFQEYLEDFASKETYRIGVERIQKELSILPSAQSKLVKEAICALKSGKRDIFL
jgi:2-iminoacetate synthase